MRRSLQIRPLDWTIGYRGREMVWIWPCLLLALAVAMPARAETPRGSYFYAGVDQCREDQKLSDTLCANAAANAEAEFDEKTPRFSTRRECDARFGAGRCELSLKGVDGWSGKRSGISFMPRQSGFRVTVRSESDMTVSPVFRGGEIGFAPRTILKLQTGRNEGMRREIAQDPRRRGTAISVPAVGPLPPPPAIDPNFNCAALLEPGAVSSTSPGCYPVPASRLRR